uniref:Uncharacterized protein n=1 Tax=Oryza glumipatula TaxID=40148 RepID=A0A0E0AQ82_9ORYZ
MQRRGKTERSDADDGRAAGGRVGCGRAWGRGRARGRRRWMRPGCSFFFQAFGSLNPCRRARIQWRFLELLGLVTEVRSLAMQSATEKVRRTPSSCLLLCISDICKDAAGHGGGGAGCGRGSGGGGGGRLDGRGGGMGPTGKILVLVWAQLQRRHFEIKLIKNAYRKFESTIMHIFVNFGWRFTNRIQ